MRENFLKDLNPDQQQIAQHTQGPVLIFAGAGSGKTRVLTYRVAYLIAKKNIHPSKILMVTFTNKAAKEMKERIRLLLGNSYETPFAGTFHSFCAKLLRIHGIRIGIPPTFSIYDDQDQLDCIKDILKILDISSKEAHPSAVLHTISEAKNELLDPRAYTEVARGYFQETVAKIYVLYQKQLAQNSALDFDDLLNMSVKLLREDAETLSWYTTRYEYLLVDEYQDTNKAQYELTKLLAKKNRNICIVGDASQSIYKWRGADFRNISNFKRDYPETAEYHLEQNYRSTQYILDAAYSVISKNTTHPILKLWTQKNGGDRVTLYEARNEHDEASFLVQSVLQTARPFSDFAVLYRTNAQSRVIEEAFLHAGIPYELVGGTRFYDRKEIKDVLSYLRVIANPKDKVSYKRLEKLGKGRLERFNTLCKTLSDDNTLIGMSTLELLDSVLDVTKYAELYDANVEEEAYRLENIKELRSVATEFPELVNFLENVALMEDKHGPDSPLEEKKNRQTVTLMTMHAAKGLEFPIVYIVGMEEGLFPHSRSLMDKEELEEERRLCYVAITRAKERLYLTYANRRLFFGTRTENMISRFIADIPQSIMDFHASLNAGRGFRREDYLL